MNILWLGFEYRLGIENEHNVLIMNKDTFNMQSIESFKPDLIIEREFNDNKSIYEYEWTHIAREMPHIKRAMWFIDTHIQYPRHIKYAKHFQYIFLAISKFVPIFQNEYKQAKVFWLPLCFPLSNLPPMLMERKKRAIFVGRMNKWYKERNEIIKKLQEEVPNFLATTDYVNVYQTMSDCIINLNRSFSEDLNYRVFEALACGTELVTNPVPDLFKIKGLHKRIHIYRKDEDAVKIIKELLSEKRKIKNERCEIRKWIANSHLLRNRVIDIIKMVENEIQCEY